MSTYKLDLTAEEVTNLIFLLEDLPDTPNWVPVLERLGKLGHPWSHRDRLAAQVYQATAQSPTEQTPESWARVCSRFKASARKCYDEVDRMVEDDEVELLDD